MDTQQQQAAQLLLLAEQQVISQQTLRQAAVSYPLFPSTADWLRHFRQLLLFGGCLLIALALMFFIAYNWPLLHHYGKFALAMAAIVLCAASAVISLYYVKQPDNAIYRAALFGASLSTGALLALIGQTYQTGADIWQLFAAWCLLMLPFVLLSHSRASWLLWYLVFNLALWRYMSAEMRFAVFSVIENRPQLLIFSGCNLLLLLIFQFVLPKTGVVAVSLPVRTAALVLLCPLTLAAMADWWHSDSDRYMLLLFIAVAAGLGLLYHRLIKDAAIVGLTAFAAIAVATSGLAKLFNTTDTFVQANLLALFVIGSSAAVTIWLKKQLKGQQHG
ncbi:DUF2157 domain-containing protein [Chromatiaceae bacterium AAb-1]|nr:DUF2157 domain-containing protein [Chromatiaceae bacterium AAb-1]